LPRQRPRIRHRSSVAVFERQDPVVRSDVAGGHNLRVVKREKNVYLAFLELRSLGVDLKSR
jgi:hypothetical protein